MTANLQWGRATFDDPNQVGEWSSLLLATAGQVPLFSGGKARPILQYVVPAGKVETIKNLLITLLPPTLLSRPGGAALRSGTAFLVVDGVTKAELSLNPVPLNSASTKRTTNWYRSHLMNGGEGVTFTSGQVVKIQVTPLAVATNIVLPCKYVARLHGKDPLTHAPLLQIGALRTPLSGTPLDVLSYTVVAGDFTLLSWEIDVFAVNPTIATVQVFLNGACVVELGYLTFDMEHCVFNPNVSSGALNLLGGAWGLKLNHGDRIEVFGHAELDYGQAVGAQIACNQVSETGVQPAFLVGV